jgi:glycosyltransferase involved in cell wall biosynthesis
LKVVHVVEALAGGVTTYFKDLSIYFGEECKSNEIETTIIFSGRRKEVVLKKIESEFSKKITLSEVEMYREFSPIRDIVSTVKLYKKLKAIQPDVVHLHSSKAGVIGRLACLPLYSKPKIFYTPHGYSFIRSDISTISKKIYWFIEKYIQMFFGGTTIACGDTEYEFAKKIGKSVLNRNGIAIEEVRKHCSHFENTILTIGIVARITSARNPQLFNQIANLFPNYQFVWIGDGELRHFITAPNIRITGWFMESNKVLEELNKIDVYLQTSLWEGLPIAVLEAMVMEKPVIATNIIGNKDVVDNGETGFLFDDIHELKGLLEVLENANTRKKFGEKALERCYLLFDKNKNFENLASLYLS